MLFLVRGVDHQARSQAAGGGLLRSRLGLLFRLGLRLVLGIIGLLDGGGLNLGLRLSLLLGGSLAGHFDALELHLAVLCSHRGRRRAGGADGAQVFVTGDRLGGGNSGQGNDAGGSQGQAGLLGGAGKGALRGAATAFAVLVPHGGQQGSIFGATAAAHRLIGLQRGGPLICACEVSCRIRERVHSARSAANNVPSMLLTELHPKAPPSAVCGSSAPVWKELNGLIR